MVGLRRSVVIWLSACALGAASVAIIAATTTPARAAGLEARQATPRAGTLPGQANRATRAATPLLRSMQAMLARRARRQRPAHFTS